MQPDNELLCEYARAGSEPAFAELVKRHVNLVYSAALRQTAGDTQLAHDVAQTVFADLARKAASLSRHASLSGWLYTSACFAAGKMVRTETRRREREEKFMRDPAHEPSPAADWEKLRPILDAAMLGLNDTDREAILLRYFENRPYAEVGLKLGLTENTARMRVERALEKLRALLAKRAINTTATATATLASVISANAVQVAPSALAAHIAKASIAAGTATSLKVLKSMTLSHLKLGIGAVAVAGVAMTMVLQNYKQHELQNENESMRGQFEQLKTDTASLSNQISFTKDSSTLSEIEFKELMSLRAEVTQLRSAKNRLMEPHVRATNVVANMANGVGEDETTEICVEARFAWAPAVQIPEIKLGWTSVGDGASMVSKEQLAQTLKKIEDRKFLIHEGRVTTLNGHNANFQILESDSNDTTNTFGPTIDVVSHFSTNSSIFTLNLLACLFVRSSDPLHPTQALQTSNQVQLVPGQTVALERDMPPEMGWTLPEFSNSPIKLLVFVTPTAIDASGNALKTVESPTAQAIPDDQSILPSSVANGNKFPNQ